MARKQADAPASAADDVLRIRNAIDTYHQDYLRRFWNARRAEIMQSGNPVRIRLLAEHDSRERNRQ